MKSAREAATSPPLCFTTGFPGHPKGLLPQNLFNSSNAVHSSGNNNVSMSGQGIERGGREGHIHNNVLDGSTLTGGNQGICFNLGSTGSGVFNEWFTNNHCKNFSSAGGGGNSIGTQDRIHIEQNIFENSGQFNLTGGMDINSVVCGTPSATCENDTVVHGLSTFIGNTIISNTTPGGLRLAAVTGLTKSASLESVDVEGNTYQVNYPWPSGSNHIDIGGSIDIWKPSTTYTADSNGYAYPTVMNGYVYNATVAGTTGTSEPTWPTTIGGTVKDGGITWICAYTQPHWTIKNETFNMPTGYVQSSTGYDVTLDNPPRDMLSMSNVTGNYAWQIYHRIGNGRGNMAGKHNEVIPANTPDSDSNRFFNILPSSPTYTSFAQATYFSLGARIIPTTGNVGQIVTTAGWNAPTWMASTVYNAYSYVQAYPSDNGHFYRNLTACTSNGSAPTFRISSGATVVDDTCTWQESGPDAVFAGLASSAASAAIGNIAISPGGSATVQFTSAAQNGFDSPLTLTASGAPAGVSLKFSTSTISAGQGASLTISTTTKTATAVKTITVTATGGGQSKTVAIPLTVTAAVKT
jgi:hypothetical protein